MYNLRGVVPDLHAPAIPGVPRTLALTGQLHLAALDAALETQLRLVDLIAGLLRRHHDGRNLVAGDLSFADRRALVIAIHLPAHRRAIEREFEGDIHRLPVAARRRPHP